MPIETFTFDRDEHGIGFDFAAVDDDGLRDDVGALNDFAIDHPGELRKG